MRRRRIARAYYYDASVKGPPIAGHRRLQDALGFLLGLLLCLDDLQEDHPDGVGRGVGDAHTAFSYSLAYVDGAGLHSRLTRAPAPRPPSVR